MNASALDELDPTSAEVLREHRFDEATFRALAERYRRDPASFDLTIRGLVEPPRPGDLVTMARRSSERGRHLQGLGEDAIGRGEVAVAVLNGGMATRFGGVVKGVVEVLPGRSFLQLVAHGVRAAGERAGGVIPLLLMNSVATDEPTQEHLRRTGGLGLGSGLVRCFTQNAFPRLTAGGRLLAGDDGRASLYGPGHGDFPDALRGSGSLRWLAERGVRFLVLCNVDNLGATVDPLVLGHHVDGGRPVTVELAPRWPGDRGGAPARVDGRLEIVEQFRFPPRFDQDRIGVFNTNTFVFDVAALDRDIPLDWFLVRKEVDGVTAIQFERLVGQVTATLDATWLVVPRDGAGSRFMPVKTPADLERLRPAIRARFGG